jgi:hypothetical protein
MTIFWATFCLGKFLHKQIKKWCVGVILMFQKWFDFDALDFQAEL